MNSILANDIINQLQSEREKIEWTQFHTMQADVGEITSVTIGNDYYAVIPFMSYTTVVGFTILTERNIFVEVGHYSPTTTKQVNRYCRENGLQKDYYEKRHY